jgi:uncharacterized OsmC-like protein
VLAYEDDAEGLMPEDAEPVRITRITLRPRIVVAAGTDVEKVRRIVAKGHDTCYIANSLTTDVVVEPAIEVRGE